MLIFVQNKNLKKKKKRRKAQEAVIFLSVFLHLLASQCIRDRFEILRYFADDNFYNAAKNLKD